jgi:hypothetical protein
MEQIKSAAFIEEGFNGADNSELFGGCARPSKQSHWLEALLYCWEFNGRDLIYSTAAPSPPQRDA